MARGNYERITKVIICEDCGSSFETKRVVTPICSKCKKRASDRKYYNKNKDKIIEQHRDYVNRNKEVITEKYKNFYKDNKDKISKRAKAYYRKNRDEILAKEEKKRRERGEKPNGLSGTEEVAYTFLKEMFQGYRIYKRNRKIIKSPLTGFYLELDFYIPKLKLAIELNGITHYKPVYGKEKFERQQRNDALKRELCKEKGITLIEIPLEDGVHYDRYDVQHKRLKNVLQEYLKDFVQFREDKSADMCTFEAHIRKYE